MNPVVNLEIGLIDLQSTVNVRRQGIDENVEKVKASIEQHGYWPEQPIVVRPHPDADDKYQYEHITGQCRFKACLALGLAEIPALILELSDAEAIQRSWGENEARGELTYSDRSYWVEKIFKQYSGDGKTAGEALELAANYLGVTVQTAQGYYTLSVLPEDLKKMVDTEALPTAIAKEIVKNTYDKPRFEQSQQAMRDRAEWILGRNREHRKQAVEALKELGHNASIEDLNARCDEKIKNSGRYIEYTIPSELHPKLMQWGESRGLKNESEIVGRMIMDAIEKELK